MPATAAPQRVAIIADDLTGALDAGLQLAKRNVETRVSLMGLSQSDVQAIVIDAETRHVDRDLALTRVDQAVRSCGDRLVFKKVDSTLRGHVGPEAMRICDRLGLRAALITPTFAAAGRVVIDGCLLVDGQPLHRTSLANDPMWPARTASVRCIVSRGTSAQARLIPLARVRQTARPPLASPVSPGLYVADSVTKQDLAVIARWAVAHADEVLPCGSAGLAEAWADALGLQGNGVRSWVGRRGPVLIISASHNQATQRQLRALRQHQHPHWIELDPSTVQPEAAAKQLSDVLANGSTVVLSASFSELLPGASQMIVSALGCIVHRAIASRSALTSELAGLILTGGDTAREVCAALGIAELEIIAEVESGIPGSRVSNGAFAGLPVVTKAGGFGSQQAFARALGWIHSGEID